MLKQRHDRVTRASTIMLSALLLLAYATTLTQAFTVGPKFHSMQSLSAKSLALAAQTNQHKPNIQPDTAWNQSPLPPLQQEKTTTTTRQQPSLLHHFQRAVQTTALVVALLTTTTTMTPTPPAYAASDPGKIVSCLFQKCTLPLTKCILNPKCLANIACINTCNNKQDEIGCQIQCGDLFENEVTGEFNACAVSAMNCVPQQPDDGSYPEPSSDKVVRAFDTKFFDGRLYITAGQNPLFDIFPCQVHFFSGTGKDKFVGKLNWRVQEPVCIHVYVP
jgi:hypothetical protein